MLPLEPSPAGAGLSQPRSPIEETIRTAMTAMTTAGMASGVGTAKVKVPTGMTDVLVVLDPTLSATIPW